MTNKPPKEPFLQVDHNEFWFSNTEEQCVKAVEAITLLRTFLNTHKKALIGFGSWTVGSVVSPDISFYKRHDSILGGSNNPKFNPLAIARYFGLFGWEREPDRSSCGRIDWVKNVDGIRVRIKGVEEMKPLNKTVKITQDGAF
jgi:hypothetical protein